MYVNKPQLIHLFLRKITYLLMCAIGFIMCIQCTNKQTAQLNFPKNRWYQSNVLSLDFKTLAVNQLHSIELQLSYVHGFQFSEIPFELYIITPLHQIEKTPFTLRLFDENKKEIGDCVGDYCDIKFIISENHQFNSPGDYKIKVINIFKHDYLPNVMSASVLVK